MKTCLFVKHRRQPTKTDYFPNGKVRSQIICKRSQFMKNAKQKTQDSEVCDLTALAIQILGFAKDEAHIQWNKL